jgi:hypothetical protein
LTHIVFIVQSTRDPLNVPPNASLAYLACGTWEGEICIGEWYDGEPHGAILSLCPVVKKVYIGDYSFGKRDSKQTIMIFSDGNKYEGIIPDVVAITNNRL